MNSLKQRKVADGRARLNAVAFSPDDKLLATSNTAGRARLWVLRRDELLRWKKASFPGLDCSTCVAFSPDGGSVTASGFGIRLLNVELFAGGGAGFDCVGNEVGKEAGKARQAGSSIEPQRHDDPPGF